MKKFLNLTALLTMFAALSFGIMSCDDGDFTDFIGAKESKGGDDPTPTVLNCTVKFNNNGGEGTMDPIIYKQGETVTSFPTCTFTNGDKEFWCWSTSEDSSGTLGNSWVVPAKDEVTLYALWMVKGEAGYVVSYALETDYQSGRYSEDHSVNRKGTIGAEATYELKTFENYKFVKAVYNVADKKIAENGKTVVELRYDVIDSTGVKVGSTLNVGGIKDITLTKETYGDNQHWLLKVPGLYYKDKDKTASVTWYIDGTKLISSGDGANATTLKATEKSSFGTVTAENKYPCDQLIYDTTGKSKGEVHEIVVVVTNAFGTDTIIRSKRASIIVE